MRDLSSNINCVSFFTGGGGLEQGLRKVLGERLRCIAYVERDAYCVENLISKIEAEELDAAPVFTDVTTFPADKFRGMVDLFCGGYPCQPESIAGQQLGAEDPRFLWPYCRSFVAAVRPVWLFFENVRGHVNTSMVEVLRDLAELQYAVEPGIFSAEECGGTHSRERVFILARDMAHSDSELHDRSGLGGSGWWPQLTDGGSKLVFTKGGNYTCGKDGFGGRGDAGVGAITGEQECTSRTAPGGSAADLAHPDSMRRPQPQGGIGELGRRAFDGVEELEHTEGIGCGTRRPEPERQQGCASVAEPGGEVATAGCQGLENSQFMGIPGKEGERGGNRAAVKQFRDPLLPQSPPGPNDADGWYRVLFNSPYLAPSLRRSEAERIFRRVADGLADESYLRELRTLFCENRTDRLRMLGNGVYPYSAALAFLVLLEKMRGNFVNKEQP